jgi:hypothetical protein
VIASCTGLCILGSIDCNEQLLAWRFGPDPRNQPSPWTRALATRRQGMIPDPLAGPHLVIARAA